MILLLPLSTLFPYTTLFRSYSVTRCVDCGHILKCPHCDCAIVYLRAKKQFTCRHCTYHVPRSEEHTSELQSQFHLVCRLLLEKKKQKINYKNKQKKYKTNQQ